MQPGVPFALLGAVVLLAVAGWVGLGAVALARSRTPRGPALLVAAGALVLAAVEVLTGTSLGDERSDLLPAARAAGLLLLGGGLYAGALARRPAASTPTGGALAVVVPLVSGPAPAVLAAAAGLAAGLAALRARRDGPGLAVAGALLLAGLAAGLGPLADDGSGALAAVLVRGAGAVLLLAALLVLARSSLLGKVVAAVLAGVLVMAVAAVGVVGTVVASSAVEEQNGLVADAAAARVQAVDERRQTLLGTVTVVADLCRRAPDRCAASFDLFAGDPGASTFAARVPADGAPRSFGGRAALTQGELLALAGNRLTELALQGGPEAVPSAGLSSVVRLVGTGPGLAAVAVLPEARPTPQDPAPAVFYYGVRLDDRFTGTSLDDGGFGLSLLSGGELVASNLTGREREQLAGIAEQAGVGSGIGEGRTVPADGDRPAVAFLPLNAVAQERPGVVALSRSAEQSLQAQERSLRALLLTAVLATVLVGAVALLLGRRTVEPVRRLTAAAQRVAAGDLSVTTGLGGRDEVGTLSRSFDAMTGSVSRLTGDLRASAARLETVLSSMTDGLVATGADGTVTSVNRAALAMAGLEEADVLGRPVAGVLDLRAAGAPFELGTGGGVDRPAEVHRTDGTTVPVRVAVAPLDGGEGLVLVLRDTTREREVERMKTEFLSNVSHELRTPLTPIRGYAEILVSKPGLDSDKVTRFATTIRDESIKMNRVVDLLVDVAAIEAGRVTVTPRPVTAGELVDGRLEAWRKKAPDRAADLKRRVATRLPRVDVDPLWVGKALDELVDNALKYTPPGTTVTLTAALSPGGDRVRVAVRDQGPGIAEADQEGLFLSFEQVDGSATRRVGGLGLGLSFVRRLADDAGFPLTVTSAVGRGAEFALDLPLAVVAPARRRRTP